MSGRPGAFWEESTVGVVLGGDPAADQQRRAYQDESDDGGQFDHGEPELGASIGADAAQIDDEQERGENQNPNVGADAGEPVRHVCGRCNHFGADGEREADPVSGAGDESSEGADVEFAVDAETSGGGMSAGQFAEGHGDGPVDEGGGQKAEDSGGAGDLHSRARSKEQAGSDGASNGDHRHLPGGQLVVEAGLVCGRRRSGGVGRQGSKISKKSGMPKAVPIDKCGGDLRNRQGSLLRCRWLGALLESEQGYSAPNPHA